MRNKAKWIFEPDCFQDHNPERLAEIAKRHGHEFQMLPHNLRRIDLGHKVNLKYPDDDNVVVYGSIELMQYVQRNHRWYPEWCDWEQLRTVTYMGHWGYRSIHTDYGFYPYGEVVRSAGAIETLFGNDDGVFVRPDTNDKIIGSGYVVRDWEQWRQSTKAYGASPQTLVMCSRPRKITREWRCVIAEENFVTGSRYMLNGSAELERIGYDGVAKFCENVIAKAETRWTPAPIFTMDVAESEGTLFLLEIGSINVSGLYECDLEKVFDRASEMAEKEHSIIFDLTK